MERFVSVSTFTAASPSLIPPSSSASSHTYLPHQDLLQSSDEDIVVFRYDANPAVYGVFFGFDAASAAPLADTTILAPALLDAENASVIGLLRKKDSPGGRRQKKYSDSFGQIFQSDTTSLASAVRQLAEYWHPDELKVGTHSIFLNLCKTFVVDMFRSGTRIVFFRSLFKTYLDIEGHWLHLFFSSKLGRFLDCYVVDHADDFESVNHFL